MPPTSIAKPLPTFHKSNHDDASKRKPSKNRANQSSTSASKLKDDTPRAFARLLNFQKTGKRPTHTLDDGSTRKNKKRKRETETNDPNQTPSTPKAPPITINTTTTPDPDPATAGPPTLKILPGERLAEFSARVNQALPIAGLRTKGQPHNNKTDERKTKHNRRLERMQKEWREAETRRQEKLTEAMEEQEDEREEHQLLWGGIVARTGKKKKKMMMARRVADGGGGDGVGVGAGAVDDDDDDPWAELAEKRRHTRQKNLQDVVLAPPQLQRVIKAPLRHHVPPPQSLAGPGVDAGNVPAQVGSWRRREEVGAARRIVIDRYREMVMTGRRKGHGVKA